MAIMMLNGQFVKEEEATLSVMDHGLLYGVGFFETLRVYQRHPFLIDDHLDRLYQGLDLLSISSSPTSTSSSLFSTARWEDSIQELLDQNQLEDAYVRITVTGGEAPLGLSSTYNSPTSMIFVRPLHKAQLEAAEKGKQLQIIPFPKDSVRMGLKTTNYLNHVRARQVTSDFPQTEGLFLTPTGELAEGIVSNLFFVSKNQLYTPSLDTGIVAGITRAFVIALARSLGYGVHEGRYTVEDLDKADEIFITNSIQEIVPVHSWNGQSKTMKPSRVDEWIWQYRSYTTYLRSVRELIGENIDTKHRESAK